LRKGTKRRFGHGELHLALLALLNGRPMHGYELMGELAARMGPRYKPSPGSIYPAIAALNDESLITAEVHGGKKVYQLTPLGRTALEHRLDELARLEDDLGVTLTDGSVEMSITRFAERVREIAPRVDQVVLEGELDRTLTMLEGLAKEGT